MQYFKSFVTMEHQPITTTYDPDTKSRRACQSLVEVLETRQIKPNTVHSQLEKRLCASALLPGYAGTYRPEGLVFETDVSPAFVVPFDLMALTNGKTCTSSDYYDQFMQGSERFRYGRLDLMLKDFPDSRSAVQSLDLFRQEHGLDPMPKESMDYNECCFTKDVPIRPIAIIGQTHTYLAISEKYAVPRFGSIDEFLNAKSPSFYDFTRKSVMGAFFRVGSSFGIDAFGYLALTGGTFQKFLDRFQWDKFLSVTAAVVAINFVDYKFDITNKLDRLAQNTLARIIPIERKGK